MEKSNLPAGRQEKMLGSVTIPQAISDEVTQNVHHIADYKKIIEGHATQNTTNLLDVILFGAIHLGASDIHIEPQEHNTRLRVRLDGLLQDATAFEGPAYHSLLNRLKLESKLKLNITNKPQDGRFTIATGDDLIEIRTSSLPAEYGESIVMRILNPKNLIGLESLGLRKDLYEIFLQQIKKPNAMIVVTGPTGSGKTTTLYAFLMKIQNPEIKIITIEDPIEYHLQGISQTQVSAGEQHTNTLTGEKVTEKGYSFSEGLKSIVRQDPV